MHDVDLSEHTKPIVAFQEAITKSPPGVKIIYHRGKVLASSSLPRAAFNAFEAGQVELVQRRDRDAGRGVFEFIAVKRKTATSVLFLPHRNGRPETTARKCRKRK